MAAPKISVITVNRNNARGLQSTMDSVLRQNFRDYEYIVIDGASTDGSQHVVEKRLSGVKHFVSERDNGIYEAMNKGIALARGEFLLFINSGDTLHKRSTLRKAAPHLTGESDIVYGDMIIDNNGSVSRGRMPDMIDARQMVADTLWHPVSFIKKELFSRYGDFDTSYRICGDYEFFFRIIVGKKVIAHHIHQFICVFKLDGLSSDPANAARIREERERAQLTYLSHEVIESLRQESPRVEKGKKRWFRLFRS